MGAKIAVEWMGEILKGLAQWFRLPVKDLSDLQDHNPAPTFTFDSSGFDGQQININVRPIQQPLYDNAGITFGAPVQTWFTTYTGDGAGIHRPFETVYMTGELASAI